MQGRRRVSALANGLRPSESDGLGHKSPGLLVAHQFLAQAPAHLDLHRAGPSSAGLLETLLRQGAEIVLECRPCQLLLRAHVYGHAAQGNAERQPQGGPQQLHADAPGDLVSAKAHDEVRPSSRVRIFATMQIDVEARLADTEELLDLAKIPRPRAVQQLFPASEVRVPVRRVRMALLLIELQRALFLMLCPCQVGTPDGLGELSRQAGRERLGLVRLVAFPAKRQRMRRREEDARFGERRR
mmetsp:Transcript_32394/g.94817  ORF Transcript_32394/g.94817 Transcript_32394/m.94817 type:complete len:242 (+) Transcript_32394:109-834(+)